MQPCNLKNYSLMIASISKSKLIEWIFLQSNGTSIYLSFLFIMKPVRDNLALSHFSDLKELISQNGYKTKTNPCFLWSPLFQSMKLQKCITQESPKEGLHPQCQPFLRWMTLSTIINPASMDFFNAHTYSFFKKYLCSSLFSTR